MTLLDWFKLFLGIAMGFIFVMAMLQGASN